MANLPKRRRPGYADRVFVNCPFDPEYAPLFRALVFAVMCCEFVVCCSLEVDDAGETRAEKLIRLIQDCRFGIHDISRTESNAEGLPRFNMPYELGLFVGFKHSSDPAQRRKAVLILDRERYRYQRFLSDVAGQDIRSHDNQPEVLIREVRNWLRNQTTRELVGAARIVEQFGLFLDELPQLLAALHLTDADLDNYRDYHQLAYNWIRGNPAGGRT